VNKAATQASRKMHAAETITLKAQTNIQVGELMTVDAKAKKAAWKQKVQNKITEISTQTSTQKDAMTTGGAKNNGGI